MSDLGPIVFDDLERLTLDQREIGVYDGPIGLRLLYEDAASGEEHYLIRYPAGLEAQWHRHSAAHTIVVLEGKLMVNGRVIGSGSYCHYPAGEPMHHAPADNEPCLFLNLFHGPSDVEQIDSPKPPTAEQTKAVS